jgi:putative PIN family toxin of toxin-antitoxin system
MIRAVLDTNLLVSYLLTHRPPIAQAEPLSGSALIDHHLAQDDFVLVTAPELLAELDRVLTYPKLQRYYTNEERTRFVALVMALSEVVDLPISPEGETTIPRVCRDPDDDRVIACAVVGGADVIVSGDEALLDLDRAGGISILTATQFLDLLEQGN